jgi:hypothetical protein
MSIRTPQRPGGGMFGPRQVAVYKPRGRFAGILFGALYRFLAGQVVLRRPGKWDARYLTWAPAVPDHVAQGREEAPRSTWARRPGYQRQLARLGAIAAVIDYFRAPVLTLVILAVLALVAIARVVVMAHRRHVYGPVIASWWDYVAGKTGASGDPLHWVRFTSWEIRWEPVTPLAAATRAKPPDVDPDQGAPPSGVDAAYSARRLRDRGGWLTRWAPPLARLLRPLASPIGEQAWVINARARFAGDHRLWVALVARTVELLVRLAERSRTIRVRPHLVKHALTSDNARIEIHYPATYPAHPQDIAEIQRVLRDRLPARAPDLNAPADDDDPEDQDEDTEAALPVGAWTARNDHKHLMIVFERTKLMPTDVPMTRADFEGLPFHSIPIGVEVTRRGRRRLVLIPLKAKTPHVSVAASTGWGKTTIANVISAHLLYHGAFGMFLDPKSIGYVDAYRGASPYLEIRTTVAGWMDAILRVRDEMNRRYWLMEQCADRVKALGLPKMTEHAEMYFQPLFVLEDEKGSLTTAIANWFKREGGPDGKPGKGTPPSFDQQQEILWRGRAAAVHIVTMAQQNNARVFLNTDMRDQYMFRILAGPQTRQSWDMTFPGTKKRAIPKKKGRAVYGIGPEGIRDVHLGRISDTEARECAIHGIGVADQENQVRAELLALATGRPVWEVSPLPFWVAPPAQTAAPVPGHTPEGDALRPVALPPVPPALSVVKNGPVSTPDADLDDPEDDDLDIENDHNFTSTRDDEETPDLIVGEAAAADYLGITLAAFTKRRKRARNGECPTINGEIRVGRSPAWPALELTEWNNLFRTAG